MERRPDNPTGEPNPSEPQLLIEHSLGGAIVPQRPTDGYINATRLCDMAGKEFRNYSRSTSY